MKEDDFSFSNLKRFVYLEGVQKETTRMYGPGTLGNFSRLCIKDHELKGIPIKKGVLIHNAPMGLHMSEKYYKNPTEFRPERWLGECDHNPSYSFLGFSGGPRVCIGKHLVQLETKIAVIKFMQRF